MNPSKVEDDTAILPWIVADVVAREYDLGHEVSTYLEWRCEQSYNGHEQFRKLIRKKGNAGRDNLYMFMRHWCDAIVNNPAILDERMPRMDKSVEG